MKKIFIEWLIKRWLKGYHLAKDRPRKSKPKIESTELNFIVDENTTLYHEERLEHKEGAN